MLDEVKAENINKRSELLQLLQDDLDLMKFYNLVFLSDFVSSVDWMALKLGIDKDQAYRYQDILLKLGVWKLAEGGRIYSTERFLALEAQNTNPENFVKSFVVANADVVSRLSLNGACWFDYTLIATTSAIRERFVTDIKVALQRFIQDSNSGPGTEIVAWSHAFTDILQTEKNLGGMN